MNFDTIFFIVVGIVVAVVIIVILLVVWNNFNKQEELLKSELEQYKKEYVDNIPDIALRVMGSNLLELKEYYIMTKRQYTRTFIITTFFSSIGCAIILGGVIYGAIIGDFEVSKYTTISGLVSEAVAYLAFWMFTQAKNQLNRYSSQLRENEKVLCAITIIEKIDVGQKKESIDKILEYLLKKEDG